MFPRMASAPSGHMAMQRPSYGNKRGDGPLSDLHSADVKQQVEQSLTIKLVVLFQTVNAYGSIQKSGLS